MYAISAKNLTKSYNGSTNALNNLNINIEKGTIFGFLGPNGAGKTTTVKLLTGLLTPTKGECSVLGMSPQKNSCTVHSLCGVMTETAKMYGQLTGIQNLEFFAQTYGIKKDEGIKRAQKLLKQLDLWDARDKKLSDYSTGMTQRLSLARSLINKPKILFLDEPTSGLDPESAQSVNKIILSLVKNTGVTVFLCTHQLRYAQDICNSYGIIEQGNVIAKGSFETLCENIGCKIKAEFRLSEDDKLECFNKNNDWWQTELQNEDEMPKLLKSIINSGHQVYEARLVRPDLEDVYFEYTKHEKVKS